MKCSIFTYVHIHTNILQLLTYTHSIIEEILSITFEIIKFIILVSDCCCCFRFMLKVKIFSNLHFFFFIFFFSFLLFFFSRLCTFSLTKVSLAYISVSPFCYFFFLPYFSLLTLSFLVGRHERAKLIVLLLDWFSCNEKLLYLTRS